MRPRMNRRRFLALGGLAGGAALAACGSPAPTVPPVSGSTTSATPPPSASGSPQATGLADPARRRVADAVISSFENSSTALPYDVAERLDDGRGITAGRAGFTSGTHDLLLVVQRYQRAAGTTALSRYLPALSAIDAAVRDGGDGADTTGLDGFEAVWQSTARSDPRLDRAQDAVFDQLSFAPAMAEARRLGVRTALGQLVLLDSAVQHGTDTDPDGLPTMVAQAGEAFGSGPARDEVGWLRAFLRVRRAHLLAPAAEETTEVWRESVPRVDTLATLLDEDRLDLAAPLSWSFAGQRFRVDG